MRTVSFSMNISIDGYCNHDMNGMIPSEEMMDYFAGLMDDVDLLFFGRVMYELMFPYWSDVARDQSGTAAENRFGERLSAIDSVVVSRTLNSVNANTRIIRSNPAAELLKLKQEAGKKISVDTVSMLPEFISAGLIDEFNLVVHPVIVGKGRPLLPAGSLQENLDLKLADTKRFENGCLALQYLKR